MTAQDFIFHRILQRRCFDHGNCFTLDKSHLGDPLAECTAPFHLGDNPGIALLQVKQR